MVTALFALVLFCSPTTAATQSSEVADLRRIIDGLRKQIVDLKRENFGLHKEMTAKDEQIANLRAMVPAHSGGAFVEVGMRKDKVDLIIGSSGTRVRGDEATVVYTWKLPNSKRVLKDSPPPKDDGFYELVCTFTSEDRELISYEVHPLD